jgi:hypothetical protein
VAVEAPLREISETRDIIEFIGTRTPILDPALRLEDWAAEKIATFGGHPWPLVVAIVGILPREG